MNKSILTCFVLVWGVVIFLFMPVSPQEKVKTLTVGGEADLSVLEKYYVEQDSLYKIAFIRRLLALLQDYSAECYADSIRVSSGLVTMAEYSEELGYYVAIIDSVWVRQDPTLLGFMEWLQENK